MAQKKNHVHRSVRYFLVLMNPQLFCPIRGALKAKLKAKDGLTFTEEKRRIDCINLLLSKGYPKDRIEAETKVIKFGHKGKNSLRADIVVYDRSIVSVKALAEDKRRGCMKIIGEIKRGFADADSAKSEQLKPALDLIPSTDVLGIYWDDVEQSIFYKKVSGSVIETVEASIAMLPAFGSPLAAKDIHYGDLKPDTDLVKRFARLDDILHQAGHSKDDRYDILFKLLLTKIFDEQSNRPKNGRMIVQDFSVGDVPDSDILEIFEKGLESALTLYGSHLPKKPSKKIGCSGASLRQIAKIICPIDILGSSPQVIQDFFMYFGRSLYKVDLAQYFTPYEVIDLIVRIVNPKFGDVVRDPACGTADFLVGAMRVAEERHGANIAAQLHGVDTADMAVTLSVFNMILNGDGSSHIEQGDSLKELPKHEGKYTVALCNPPFGTRIVEKRKEVLAQFELGTEEVSGKRVPLKSQETGLLFVEVCLRSVRAGGRVGILLPNGYLGNRGGRYQVFREWLLRHARVAAVIGFPRFTFKKSGADVSASVVVLEKREEPLADLSTMADFPIHFNLVEKVGWDLQSKRSGRIYKRDPRDGSLVLDADSNEPVLDADFERVLSDLYSSTVVDAFDWLADGVTGAASTGGWIVQAADVIARSDLCLDPKRWSSKHASLVEAIASVNHFKISDVIRPVSRRLKKKADATYRYVEIEKMYESFGAYISNDYYGWALPDRGKQVAAPGDIFIANIWSSAGKWMIAGDEASDGHLIVTTGCTHFEIIPGQEPLLPDLVFGLSSEAFRVQMRALATGSDGLSSIATEDICSVILPKITTGAVREQFRDRVAEAKAGQLVLPRVVREELALTAPGTNVPLRSAHVVQV
ncbi:restriction endonuclease subunit M [Sphingomonas oligoaromativorans]|uniref:restriction endonuclease subunit M n=1 Tax=Sphingomonas oligoaromativorans TaxID=575322 RepID=UPI00141E6B2A|nr:N-6 DNA methylase [Sphingomonas oligoaromativorans]NIJ34950.1 type I restriction enzyme M protein [Sphingomonas oligoaromativorans]